MQECRTRLFGRQGASLNSHGRFGRHLVFRDTSGGHVPTLLVVARVWYLYGWSCTRSSICLLLLLLLFTYACMSTSCASDGRGGGVALIGIPISILGPSFAETFMIARWQRRRQSSQVAQRWQSSHVAENKVQ